jgi:hypothetical protein
MPRRFLVNCYHRRDGDGYRWYSESDRRVVASALNISAPPPSLQVIACDSPFTTDVHTTCWIGIEPREFPLLLKGYNFEESPITGTIYGFKRLTSVIEPQALLTVGGSRAGSDFPVTLEYMIQPKEFQHGGSVRILADATRRHAVVHLYVE